jgi:hypothetical protein
MRWEHWFYTVPLRLRSVLRRKDVERELEEELRYHQERKTEQYVARGLTPDEAHYAALRAMNGLEQRKEECCDSPHGCWRKHPVSPPRRCSLWRWALARIPPYSAW